jgi:hypothetical protein
MDLSSQSPLCRRQIFSSFEKHPASGRLTQEKNGAFLACAMALSLALNTSATGLMPMPSAWTQWNKRSCHHAQSANYNERNQKYERSKLNQKHTAKPNRTRK